MRTSDNAISIVDKIAAAPAATVTAPINKQSE